MTSGPRRRRRVALLLLLVVTALTAPARAQESPLRSDRAPDGLLRRPELQELVDLQVARDGRGLAARLSDPDPSVRARAAFALGSVQEPAVVHPLLGALDDPDPRVRADAAFALGQSGVESAPVDPAASDRLLAALAEERDPVVRGRLYEALGKTGDGGSLARLAASEVPASDLAAFAMAIARYGLRGVFDPAAVRRLAALLDHADPGVREAAAYPLARWRDTAPWAEAAGAALRAAVDAAYPFQVGGPRVIALEGPAPEIQLVTALDRLGDTADTPRLARWLEDAVDWRVRVVAARALGGRASDTTAARGLLAGLDDPSTHVGVAASAALAAADSLPPEALRQLATRAAMPRGEWRVEAEALPVLARAAGESVVLVWLMQLDARDRDNAAARAKALRALGQGRAVPGFRVLEHGATSHDARVATASVAALAERWRRGVVDSVATRERYFRAFAQALESGDVGTVSEAAPALADSAFAALGASELLTRSYHALELPRDLEAMMAVVEALERTGDPAARPLVEAFRHSREVLDPPQRAVDWPALAELGGRPRLVLDTERGRIVVELDAEQAPLTVQTIAGLARARRYDGVPFHRVVPNFVIQGGDFERGDGYGGPGYQIRSELGRIGFQRGVIGMASAGKDTEGSQFFLTHSIQPHLDGRYTAFGAVREGLDVLDAILEGERVVRATIEPEI